MLVPLELKVLGRVFGLEGHPSGGAIAQVVVITVLAPLAIGLIVRLIVPRFATWLAKPLSLSGAVTLGLSAVAMPFGSWQSLTSLTGDGTVAVITFPGEKTVLAAVLLYLLWSTIVSVPHLLWRRRRLVGTG